ncbi:MAG: glycoside hydrolase family 108 protein [Sphingomonas oligoaromativorans]
MTIDAMIEATIAKEGGYTDHPSDPGGPTMFGITQAVARANGYMGDMRNLSRDQAKAIYRSEYAIKPGFAAVEAINGPIGAELFDTGVNMGPAFPALWFQQALNAFNARGTLYPDIIEDADQPAGGIGPKTLAAFRSYLAMRGAMAVTVMLCALNARQGARYLDLARARVANEDFVFGWIAQRVS